MRDPHKLYGELQKHLFILHAFSSQSVIFPEKLSSTTRAAVYQGLRVHYQIWVWSALEDSVDTNSTQYGAGYVTKTCWYQK